MVKAAYAVLLVLAFAGAASANTLTAAPEIDASTLVGGIGLLTAGVLLIRARSKR